MHRSVLASAIPVVCLAACSPKGSAPAGSTSIDAGMAATKEAGSCDPSPPSCVPLNAGCAGSQYCCQTGADMPVGAGCVALTNSCVPRCNSGADCAAGSCCVGNPSSVPAPGFPPGEPGGWCLPEAEAEGSGLACISGYGNGYVCEGTFTCGYLCATADGGAPDTHDAAVAPATGADASDSEAPPIEGTPVIDPDCVNVTTDTLSVAGYGVFSSSHRGDFQPTLSMLGSGGGTGSISVTAPYGNDMNLAVQASYLAAPGLEAGGTYALHESTGIPGLVPVVRITAPNGAVCDVDQGTLTLNTLNVASDGYTINEVEASWTGMRCTPYTFSPKGVQSDATGPGCFHAFAENSVAPVEDAGSIPSDAAGAGGTCPTPMGGSCTAIANVGSPIAITCASGSPPAMTGGAIAEGTYALAAITYYGAGAADAGVCGVAGPAETFLFSSGCAQAISTAGNGPPTSSAIYAASGGQLTLTPVCPSAETPITYPYTATATTILLNAQPTAGTVVITTLQKR